MFAVDVLVNQLGGIGKLKIMIGATGFIKSASSLSFSFKGSRVANRVQISIKNDLYTIIFYKQRGVNCPIVKEFHDIGVEQLKPTIENFVKLRLSL